MKRGHIHRWDVASELVGDTGIEPVTSSVSSSREAVAEGLVRGQAWCPRLRRSRAVRLVAVLPRCTALRRGQARPARGRLQAAALATLTNVFPSLQFTDFHKFLVSAGGLTCVASGALPFFLLRTQKTVFTTSQQLDELSPDARSAAETQQAQLLWLLKVWPWISVFLLLVGAVLILVGAFQWRSRQNVLNKRDTAEIDKLNAERGKADAEKEKIYQESIALSRINKESPAETSKSLEEKAIEAVEDAATPDEHFGDGETPDLNIEPEDLPTDSTTAALNTIVAASQDLPAEARGYIETISALELTSQAIRRSLPDASITRNVRIGSTRADFVITSRDQERFDLAIDVRRITQNFGQPREIVNRIRKWANAVAETTNPVPLKNYRPLSILILPDDESWRVSGSRLHELVRLVVDPGLLWMTYAPLTVLLLSPSAIQEEDLRLNVLSELPPDDSKSRVFMVQDAAASSQLIAES
jgi:hypothetical protein